MRLASFIDCRTAKEGQFNVAVDVRRDFQDILTKGANLTRFGWLAFGFNERLDGNVRRFLFRNVPAR